LISGFYPQFLIWYMIQVKHASNSQKLKVRKLAQAVPVAKIDRLFGRSTNIEQNVIAPRDIFPGNPPLNSVSEIIENPQAGFLDLQNMS